jgi:hypothetical protein
MKHKYKSASPCELAYSIDDPPRPVSTPENSSMGDVYLSAVLEYPAWCVHRLWCPHLSDHRGPACSLSGLWQQSNPDHGRTVPIPVPASFLRRRSADTCLARKVARKLARRNFQKSLKNTQSGTQNTLFFSEDPNVDSRSCLISSPMARAARTEDQDEDVRSFDARQTLDFSTQNVFLKLNLAAIFRLQPSVIRVPPSTLNPEIPQPIPSRSACSAYPFEKIPNLFQPLLPCAETIAEILLRFAETSQQTLRQISLLPTTYINFAEKNALKSKLLRLLRLDPKLDSLFVGGASTFRSAGSPVRPLWRAATVPFATTFRKANNSYWAPDSWRAGAANFAYSVVQRIDPLSPDFPTQNAFLKLNLAAIFSLQPLALSLSHRSRSACSAYRFEKNLAFSPQPSAFALHLSSQGRYVATWPCRSEPFVVRFAETTAEILLRFAETSQHLLRHCWLVPTTYNNFTAENGETAKTLRLLRQKQKNETKGKQ